MSVSDLDQEKARRERDLRIQRQIAFASGLFQGDVTVRTLLESVAEGVVIVDTSGTILLVNAAAERMFGYPKEELIGRPHAVLLPEHVLKVHEEHEAGFFTEPRIRPMGQLLELSGRRSDGSEFPVEISLGFIETINGVLVLALVSDMTLRKQFETRLKVSEELFHIQVECVKDHAVFMLDAGGNVLNWNAGAERLKGYGEQEIIGRHFSCFYPEEARDAGKPAEMLKKAVAEGRAADEGWRIRKDGSRFWADVTITAIQDEKGSLRGFSKVTRDITERKKTEDALRFSEERYRALFRDNPTMIVTLDTDLTMLSVNPICGCLLGYTIDELEGRSVLMLFHEDDRPAVTEQLRKCLENSGQVHRWQFRKTRKDGTLLWVEETAQAVYDLNGALNLLVVCQDITERKRAEESLRESEQRFASFMLHLPAAAWMKDLHGRYVYANAEAERIFSTPLSALLDRTDGELFPPETARQFRENDELALTEGGSLQATELLHQANGIVHHSIVSKFAVPGPDGQPAYIAGVAFDVTDRKQAEEALRESEEKFSRIFDTAPVGITISSLEDDRFLEINREGERLSGYRRDEVVGRSALELNIWKDSVERARMIEEVLKKGAVRDREMTFHDKEGNILLGLYSAVVIEIGGKKHLISIVSDITDRKRAEEALRKSELKLSKIFHTVPALIGITTVAEGRCIDINETGLRTLGYRREEIVGRTTLELGIWESESARDRVIRALEENGMVRDLEVNFRGKDGKTFTGLFSAELVDFNGNRYMLSIVNDITERKRMEEEIERLNTDLAARAYELEIANREMEAFNYTVAHDLRKPLAVVNGYCQALSELCGERLDEACKEYLREAYDGTLRMNRLIDALLKFSHLAHVELRRESVDLSAVAHEVAAELQLSEAGRRVTFNIAEGAVVNGDLNLLRIVLDNLLGNAWKYTAMREEAVIEFGVTQIDGRPAHFVRDNGAGFAMADAEKLFVPFRRLPGTEKFKGFGIGLATVARIMERHGGRVWAEGEPDKGATFFFTL